MVVGPELMRQLHLETYGDEEQLISEKAPDNCSTCRWFSDKHDCHRYPPTIIFTNMASSNGHAWPEFATHFPYVQGDDYCGEFTARD